MRLEGGSVKECVGRGARRHGGGAAPRRALVAAVPECWAVSVPLGT
jgi:hypothetical protein